MISPEQRLVLNGVVIEAVESSLRNPTAISQRAVLQQIRRTAELRGLDTFAVPDEELWQLAHNVLQAAGKKGPFNT